MEKYFFPKLLRMMISYFGLASPRGCLIRFVTVLFLIYFPMAAGCYFALGDQVKDNIVTAMSTGWQRVVVEIMLLLHLITAYPIITNPPAQFFEQLFKIPSGQD